MALKITIHDQRVKLSSINTKEEYLVNQDEFNEARAQICEQDLDGYYIVFNNKKIAIDRNGELADWPKGLFDTTQTTFARLVAARKAKNI